MKINLILGIVVFFGLAILSIGENIPAFMDTASLLIVAGGALCFGVTASGTFFSDSRLVAASDGAVISGWLGSFTGAVLIAGNINGNWEALGPAIAVMLLTVLYGYFIKAVIKMILISRNNGREATGLRSLCIQDMSPAVGKKKILAVTVSNAYGAYIRKIASG